MLAACAREPETKQVRGLIVNVAAASITQLEALELRTDDGQLLRFRVEGDVGITPSHSREHMVLAEPVTVTYRDTPDGRLALRVDD
ncbi:MAG TPA: hypothetical protein VEQ11_22130 [Chloroflexota bacterium]|nr:hypothetical protein [Chloroflexota bacterium]